MSKNSQTKNTNIRIAIIGGILVTLILVAGTVWNIRSTTKDTKDAIRSVSFLYLDELAGRREQVIEKNLNDNIRIIHTAVESLTEDDLSDTKHLQDFQKRMKALFHLEKFAFVDENGLIYTSQGTQDNIDEYDFDYRNIDGAEIFVKDIETENKKVIIAVPVNHIPFEGQKLVACFMEKTMDEMIQGVSISSDERNSTFCNIYSAEGISLSDIVLSGQADVSNLFTALEKAEFDKGFSLENVKRDFAEGKQGVISFTYNGIQETLTYYPVGGTDWMLTYLIRESIVSDHISYVSRATVVRCLMLSLLTAAVLLVMVLIMVYQTKRNALLMIEKETAETKSRVKQEELEKRLKLQEEILNQKKQGEEQDRMITALASDYWSVYYLELDTGTGVCYRQHADIENGLNAGDRFNYLEKLQLYADENVKEEFRKEFMEFVQPDNIREGLKEQRVIAYRYLVHRRGKDIYEEIRFAGVRHPEDREDHIVHAVGACFVNVDAETRKTMEQSIALQEALSAAEEANRAKTAFLSNMSHEIRTPMNAIIGLNSIILGDREISEKTREYSEKIETSAKHLLGIINDILDMSRIESGRMIIKKEEFSFPEMLKSVNTLISGQSREKGINYECHLNGKIDNYYIGDDVKIRQILLNILGNAVKFTPEGGNVTMLVEDVNHFDGKATLCFTIQDTGVGMSEDYLPKIFEPFSQEDSSSTNRYGSTGLGMPITKSMVELMNGHIEVESKKGKGSTFTVTITLTESDHEEIKTEDDVLHPHEMSVLVIDDDEVACEHAKVVLGQVGMKCESVTSGEEGIEAVRLRHGRRDNYSLILVDWKMPGLDGVETTKRIREIVGHETPVIILTSYNWDDIAQTAIDAGVDTFVAKPLFAGTVMDEFKEAFRRKNEKFAKPKVDLTGLRVLLAEDMPVNAEIMVMVLGMREIEAEIAENGRIALDMYSSHPAGYYDAILMDMRMPEMDGLEATRRIRATEKEDAKTIPIIALTANAFDEDVQRSLQAGLNAHLSKPVEPDALFETLESLIKK